MLIESFNRVWLNSFRLKRISMWPKRKMRRKWWPRQTLEFRVHHCSSSCRIRKLISVDDIHGVDSIWCWFPLHCCHIRESHDCLAPLEKKMSFEFHRNCKKNNKFICCVRNALPIENKNKTNIWFTFVNCRRNNLRNFTTKCKLSVHIHCITIDGKFGWRIIQCATNVYVAIANETLDCWS